MKDGWPSKGDKMRYLAENGYDSERDAANAKMKRGEILTVERFHLGNWQSLVEFEELTGRWNSVMFEFVSKGK